MKNYWKNMTNSLQFLQECSYHSCIMTVLDISHFKSANVSVLIGMRRLKSKAIQSLKKKKINSIQNDYKNYKQPCNIFVTFQNCKNPSKL